MTVWNVSFSQVGFFVPRYAKIFFNGDTATIFSNVLNHGNLGIGENAFLNFKGKTWENSPLALITDESAGGNGVGGNGGWVRFLSDSVLQQIIGGYNAATKSGPAFSRMALQNDRGLELLGGNTKVKNEFLFSSGHTYLRDNMMTIGDNTPGIISGYDSTKYFITGNAAGTGLLIRENIKGDDGLVTFPLGSSEQSYTPAALHNISGTGDDYYITVFDSVKMDLFSGQNMRIKGVNKTWEVGKRTEMINGETEVFLQHLIKDEGVHFKANRSNAYVSTYLQNGWDLGHPQELPYAGTLTSGSDLHGSGVNSRTFYNNLWGASYFTKFTGAGDTLLGTRLNFNAYRVSPANVRTYWNTNPESNVKYFILQRRLSTENQFSNMDTVASQVTNGGASRVELNYNSYDPNDWSGISFYRLKTVTYNNAFNYSNVVAVNNKLRVPAVTLWPNPTPDKFYLGFNGPNNFKKIIIWDNLGQRVRYEEIASRSIIEMGGLLPGTYYVGIIDADGRLFETKKLIVVGR